MRYARWWALFLFLFVLAALCSFYSRKFAPNAEFTASTPPATVFGQVRDSHGPVAAARVRFKGAREAVLTDAAGRFRLIRPPGAPTRVAAWKDGYLIAGATAGFSPFSIHLTPLPTEDCEHYAWVDPAPDKAKPQNCGNCHEEIYREWSASSHARSVSNRHFLNLYDGTDWHGGRTVGWNLLGEHPDGVGVCTACHAPAVAFDDPAYFDLRQARGTAARGVHCDYCHKVADVINEQIGLTHGRFGLKLLRPAEGQLFFGPLDDVDRGEDAFAAIYRESRYCASCHEGTVFGVHVYSTYSEWLESPARSAGKQCQACHMTPTGRLTTLAPGNGGIRRDSSTLANHRFFNGSLADMLRRCLSVKIRLAEDGKSVHTEIASRADQVGHRVPTGFVDHHVLLVVEAFRKDGQPVLPDASNPVLPDLAGKTYAGRAGRLYAKQLSDFDGHKPVPFWRAQPDGVDTRLAPGHADRCSFTFAAEIDRVRVRVLYRRFWEEVAVSKGWPDYEISVIDQTFPIMPGAEINWLAP